MDIVKKEKGELRLAIIRVEGDLGIHRSSELLAALTDLEKGKYFHIIVDLHRVKFICSAALGILISTLQGLLKRGGSLELLHLQDGVKEKFKITQLLDKFKVYGSEEEALESFDPRK